ncbi:hypothetical protein [Kurthia huakuii]|uniref:hypothetical protein n=1 Tax=Kurthia huakuii TaxID=1421019 RepID=UPI0004952AC3|nr:hypothetical protein [Kurthia huakuii]MBM7699810.1 hypothetical protein [Kurthia huakuii]
MIINIVLLVIVTLINVFTLFWDKYVYKMKERRLEEANQTAIDHLSKGAEIRVGKPLTDEEKEAIREELEEAKREPFYKRISGTSKVLFLVNLLLAISVGYSYYQATETVQIQQEYDMMEYTQNYTSYRYLGNTPMIDKKTKIETVKLYQTKINDDFYVKGYSEYSGNFYLKLTAADQEDAALKMKATTEVVSASGVTVYEGTLFINKKDKEISLLPYGYKQEAVKKEK